MQELEIPDDEILPLDAIAPGVLGLRVLMVNVFALTGPTGWTLIDAGLAGSAPHIRRWAGTHFGSAPQSIVLTHAHFDHVGALESLLSEWKVPVYLHPVEMPYVLGEQSYPSPDPSVGGGLMARMASLYPTDPINIGAVAAPLPSDGSVPDLPGWQWLDTSGHTEGHVSLFRETDRTLVVGDAFCTTKQESLLAVATQRPELHGPPAYFTTDWDAARESVRRLSALRPARVAPGHGQPMEGDETAAQLMLLAAEFDERARPAHGQYVDHPVR